MVRKSVVVFVCLVLVFCAATEAEEWHEGGTLHNAVVKGWIHTSADNRLATAADWLWEFAEEDPIFKGKLEKIADINHRIGTFKSFAKQLEACVSDEVKNDSNLSPIDPLAGAALSCYVRTFIPPAGNKLLPYEVKSESDYNDPGCKRRMKYIWLPPGSEYKILEIKALIRDIMKNEGLWCEYSVYAWIKGKEDLPIIFAEYKKEKETIVFKNNKSVFFEIYYLEKEGGR